MTTLHLEVLDARAREALDAHATAAAAEGFHLAGGTALALQLGHRRSVDFDWFRPGEFDPLDLARLLSEQGVPLVPGSTARSTLHATVLGTRVSFIEFRYALLEPLEDGGLGFSLAGLRDIGAMKLSAVAQRGARKDFYDLVALGRAGLDLRALLDAYQRRFGVRDVAHVLAALAYFDDAERDTEPVLGSRDDWSQVKATIRRQVRELASG
jgi:hypothetical protein